MYGVILLAGISASDRAEVLRALEGCDVIESGDCTDTLSCLDRHQNIDLILLDSEHIDAGVPASSTPCMPGDGSIEHTPCS